MKMTEKSQNSATYKAVVGAINTGVGNTSPSAYSRQLAAAQAGKAKHVFELGRCDRHAPKGQKRVQRCETYENREIAKNQAQIDSYSNNMKAETTSNQSTALALVDKAKALEHNTDNHSGLIKFVKEALATTYLSAMMLASLILVVAFEAGFHFAGSRAGILKAALMKMGNEDIKYASEIRRHKKAQAFKRKTASLKAGNQTTLSTPPPNWKPATQFTSNDNTGTHENQFDLFPEKTETASTENNTGLETVQATPYEEIKTEIENGKLQPTTDAIAQRIYNDSGVNLTMPKCKKVAESVMEKWQKESLNTRPSEGENMDAQKLTRKVDDNLTRKLSEIDTNKMKIDNLEQYLSGGDNADILYKFVSGKVKEKILKPTFPPMKKVVHSFLKEQQTQHNESVLDIPPMPRIQAEVENIHRRMIDDGFIVINPDAGNGKPKYRVA